MQVAAPFCLLCGVPCDDPQQCRVSDTSAVQSVVAKHCTPTSLHYRSLLALPPNERRPVCLHCSNWKRRSRKKSQRRRGGSYTPLDGVLLHAASPGHFPEPDRRCLRRLAQVAADPRNGFAAAVPHPLRTVLAGDSLLQAWWDENDRTSFFRFAETARAVRKVLVLRDGEADGARRRWRR